MALAFAAPLAATAATTGNANPQQTLQQKMQSTYHTSFPNSGN
jgi:hypothetical protein